MYEAAFQICEEESMLRAYLYACRKYMNGEEYLSLLQKSQVYQEVDSRLAKTVSEIEDGIKVLQYEDTLSNWKNQYRRISTGEM